MSRAGRAKGTAGEDIAAVYLQKLGYEIIARNARVSRFEIDIICRDHGAIVFVEVKHALSPEFGHPATWIDERKQEKLRQAAQLYLEKNGLVGNDIRFDAVTINGGQVEYYQNAF